MAGFSFGTPTTSAPSFSLGSNMATTGATGFNFGSPAPNATAPSGLQFNPPASAPGATFATPTAASGSGFSFGAPGGLSMGAPTKTQASLSFKPGGLGGGLNFGAATTPQQNTLTFGSASTTANTGLTLGSTPASNQQTLGFGSAPVTSQPLSFGSTPATSQPLSFGSTPATSQPLNFGTTTTGATPQLNFGSTPATSQPLSFGSTPATSQPLSFGTTPATSQPLSFGSTLGTTQQPLNFGNTPATTQGGISFGSTPATTQPTLNFGLSAPATTASTGFSLGTAVSAGTGLSFGLGGQTPTSKPTVSFGLATTTAAATPASTLLNFSTPKTTATTGFSLSVSAGSGTGGSLFSLPTTSAPVTSAPTPFKGLGGVDTTATQGSGQKDAKSVKENLVFPEIMPTLDTLKNFVKQQKNLSCEVSRAPVKPMHKITEDTDSLKQLLTSISSALQKNRVVANKLKIDTTKCLSLCEMAQRTHDTPPGLQNDNVAPLQFFIQLVSKFERDIQVLRQEIDNTEKHVNSLSYPAILTPQELSVALRRLHDSFVALAGRLQTAHAGVIAQKERHLSLRRHFLKDHTNIFETTSKAASTAKKLQCNVLPMTGPTPFSSMGGLHNINLMTGQDKPVTFSTGPTPLSGWGPSNIAIMSTTSGSNFLQSSGTSILNTPQPVDNQNFQLGKPPPGNKRGKR